jgi:hypothetical protein
MFRLIRWFKLLWIEITGGFVDYEPEMECCKMCTLDSRTCHYECEGL